MAVVTPIKSKKQLRAKLQQILDEIEFEEYHINVVEENGGQARIKARRHMIMPEPIRFTIEIIPIIRKPLTNKFLLHPKRTSNENTSHNH